MLSVRVTGSEDGSFELDVLRLVHCSEHCSEQFYVIYLSIYNYLAVRVKPVSMQPYHPVFSSKSWRPYRDLVAVQYSIPLFQFTLTNLFEDHVVAVVPQRFNSVKYQSEPMSHCQSPMEVRTRNRSGLR